MVNSLIDSVKDFKGKKLLAQYEPYNAFSGKFDPKKMMEKAIEKETYQQSGNYVVVTQELVDSLSTILAGKKVLEVMSGTGMLAWHLKEAGVDILATDSGDWGIQEIEPGFVKTISAVDAINKYPDADIILMCWPYMDNTAFQVLKSLHPHQMLICCGETDGCTADEDFWDNYDYEALSDVKYQSFSMIRDYFYIGKLRS